MNQCMGCQAKWPVHHRWHEVVGGYPHERVACTADRYDDAKADLQQQLATARAALREACDLLDKYRGGIGTADRPRVAELRAIGKGDK